MKARHIYILIFVVFSSAAIYSCVKKPSYPSTPLIGYNNFVRYGANPSDPDSVVLSITFEDEEGDIGLYQSDHTGIFASGNLFLVYYYDSLNAPPPNYHWCAVDTSAGPTTPFDTLKIHYSVPPVLAQTDKPQPMKGIIYVKLNRGNIFRPGDKTIMYKVYMYDRAMHKSNVISAPTTGGFTF